MKGPETKPKRAHITSTLAVLNAFDPDGDTEYTLVSAPSSAAAPHKSASVQ